MGLKKPFHGEMQMPNEIMTTIVITLAFHTGKVFSYSILFSNRNKEC